ncbi:MAG: hypothetical protein WA417_21410, partial [Stellaceae bacterium]
MRQNQLLPPGETAAHPPPRRLFRGSRLWAFLAILVAVVGALAAATRLLTRFSFWDDEGYVLISLAHYVKEGHLYTQTFSQYGPFYFYAQGLFFQLLHLPVTHDSGRLVTLVYWTASSLLAAVFGYRLSRSVFLACACGLCIMLAGLELTNEPGHPEHVLLLLYMAAACLAQAPQSGHYRLRFVLLGCVGAALTFTKINVGVFYLAGLAHALACLLPAGRIRTLGIATTLLYAIAAPWLLMHGSFDHGFHGYCLLATAGGVVVFAEGAALRARPRLPMAAALCCGAGLVAAAGLIVLATSLQGMSMGSLLWGVILAPLHHPQVFYIPLDIDHLGLAAALIVLAGIVGLRFWGRRLTGSWWFDVVRCGTGIGAISLLTLEHQIQWVVPLLSLTLIPQSRWTGDGTALFPRLFVACMAGTQFLEAFPVAGSQQAVAAAPMILWAFQCISDGIAGLQTNSGGRLRDILQGCRLDAAIGGIILVVFSGTSIDLAVRRHFPPAANLRGSTWLHLPPEQATQFEAVAGAVRANCTMLFSMPGMYSFNLWSGVRTPNGWNMTGWMDGIDLNEQTRILNIIKANPRACVVVNSGIKYFWDENSPGDKKAPPLVRYIETEMPRVAKFGDYEIRAQPQR